jgi:hypothetical protein
MTPSEPKGRMTPSEPKGYPPDTVMTRAWLAMALGTSEDQIERSGLLDIASYRLGTRCPRWVWKDVIAWLQGDQEAA